MRPARPPAPRTHPPASAFESFVTLFLLTLDSPPRQIQLWAAFLGLTSAGLAVVQYLPQLRKTYRMKLVGAISIPMMCVQSPGAILMVLNLALRCVSQLEVFRRWACR